MLIDRDASARLTCDAIATSFAVAATGSEVGLARALV